MTDEHLARLAAGGDERAFSQLYERYGRRLHGYCRSIVGNDEDARDVLQSAMLNALRALRRNGGDVHVRPWLFRIVHNESISLIRSRRGHEPLREDRWVTEEGPGERAEELEELDGLVDGVLQLSEHRRKALVMRELSGFGYPAIASALGTSAGAAKQAVFEARSVLSARRSAAGLLGPLARAWSAVTGWFGAGVPSAAKAGVLVAALATGTGAAEQLLDQQAPGRAATAQAAAAAPPVASLTQTATAEAAEPRSGRSRARPDGAARGGTDSGEARSPSHHEGAGADGRRASSGERHTPGGGERLGPGGDAYRGHEQPAYATGAAPAPRPDASPEHRLGAGSFSTDGQHRAPSGPRP